MSELKVEPKNKMLLLDLVRSTSTKIGSIILSDRAAESMQEIKAVVKAKAADVTLAVQVGDEVVSIANRVVKIDQAVDGKMVSMLFLHEGDVFAVLTRISDDDSI